MTYKYFFLSCRIKKQDHQPKFLGLSSRRRNLVYFMSGLPLENLPVLMMLLIKCGYYSDQQNRRKDREIEE